MNPVPFIAVAAIAYFASSVFKTLAQKKAEPEVLFRSIVATLDSLAQAGKGARKKGDNLYLFWPNGIIGAVNYNGSIATWIKADPKTHRFTITTFIFAKGTKNQLGWQKAEEETFSYKDFGQGVRHVLGLSAEAKVRLINAQRGVSAPYPPVHH